MGILTVESRTLLEGDDKNVLAKTINSSNRVSDGVAPTHPAGCSWCFKASVHRTVTSSEPTLEEFRMSRCKHGGSHHSDHSQGELSVSLFNYHVLALAEAEKERLWIPKGAPSV